jgi:predicted Ser/Thr protein kinase
MDFDAETMAPCSATGRQSPKSGSIQTTEIGHYRIVKEIARGGMGVVYLAEHVGLARRVALKTLLIQAKEDMTSVNRFAIEAEAVARLDHPGIVTIYEVGQHDGQPFLAMKYVGGGSLAQALSNGPLSVPRALTLGIQMADAISHAHERGVIHRDIKPANVLLDNDGQAVLTDFGIAKFTHAAASWLTTSGEPIGTPHFMPPEQADSGRGSIGPASDVYSIGAVIYAMLTGRPPFQAASPIDVIMQVLSSDPVPPQRLNATVPVALDAIVMMCLQKDPRKRYRSAAELASDLERCRDGKPTIAKPARGLRLLAYQLRRHFMVATVSGSIVTLLLAASLLVIIAHVRLLEKHQQIEDERASLENALSIERRMFMARQPKLNADVQLEAELLSDRLVSHIEYFKEKNPEFAVRIACELIRLTQSSSVTPPLEAVEVLRSHLTQHAADSPVLKDSDDQGTAVDVALLLEEVGKTIDDALTSDQRFLLGLENPQESSASAEVKPVEQ